jgi:hypothetical protein
MTFIEWLVLGMISEAAYQRGRSLDTPAEIDALVTHKLIFAYMRGI